MYWPTDQYNGENVRIIGFVSGCKKKEIIEEVMDAQRRGTLRAFAQNPDVDLQEKVPEYVMIVALTPMTPFIATNSMSQP